MRLALEVFQGLCGRRGPDPRHQLQHAKTRHRVARIVGPAQHRHHVLDMRRFQKLEPAVFHEGDVFLRQFDLEHVAVMRAAEQDGMALQRAAHFTRRQDLGHDVLGLVLGVVDRDVQRFLRRLPQSHQGLAMLPRSLRHEGIRAIENWLRGTVVLGQHHHVGFGTVPFGEAQNVLHGRRAEGVDGLGVVADHGHPLAVGLQRVNDFTLQGAGVLVLIDQHVIEVLRQTLRERRRLHHDVPVQEQIVEVQDVVLLFAADVLAVDPRQILFPFLAPGVLVLQGLLERQPRVDAIGVDRETGVLAGKALVLGRKTQLMTYDVHEVGGIAAVQHREILVQAQVFGRQPQYAAAHGVKSTRPHQPRGDAPVSRLTALLHRFRHDLLRASNHVLRRPPRERQHENARRIDAVQHQVRSTVRQRIGLSGTGACQDEQRAGIDPLVLR